jgi:hypothetical protein
MRELKPKEKLALNQNEPSFVCFFVSFNSCGVFGNIPHSLSIVVIVMKVVTKFMNVTVSNTESSIYDAATVL